MAKAKKQGAATLDRDLSRRVRADLAALDIKNPMRTAAQFRAAAEKMRRERPHRKPAGGRPPMDPGETKSARVAIRIHPDLRAEIARLARADGVKISMWIDRALIAAVNEQLAAEALDAIGKYQASWGPRPPGTPLPRVGAVVLPPPPAEPPPSRPKGPRPKK